MRRFVGMLVLIGTGLGCSSEPAPAPSPGSATAGSGSAAGGASSPSSGGKSVQGGAQNRGGAQSQGGMHQGQGGLLGVAGETSTPEGGNGLTGGGGGGGSPQSGACSPPGPYGKTEGSIAANVPLFDCDGNQVMLHELCANDVSVVYTFAAWCPVCKGHMQEGLPNKLLADYQSKGLVEWVVVTQDASGDFASAQLCGITRDTYELTPRVLFDASDALQASVGVQVNSGGLVLSSGAVIELNKGYDFPAIEANVAELLQ